MIINRKVSVKLEQEDKDVLREAYDIFYEIVERTGYMCPECPIQAACDKSKCPHRVIEGAFLELTGEHI